jgi:hypothetical protein
MSVQIVIGNGGAFPTTTSVFQRDLVFWLNDDTQQHYPVPGCSKLAPNGSNLQVAPGGTTPPIQPTASPNLPATIPYGCAIAGHESEGGVITVNPDSGATQTGTPGGSTTKTIDISPGGVFATVEIIQANNVVWKNNDDKTHFPVPNCTGLLVQPQGVTNAMQPNAPWAFPFAIAYGCAMPGHEAESGTINIYGDLVPAATPTLSTAAPTAPIAAGGKSPYRVTNDPKYAYLALQETAPAGSSTGVSITLLSAPTDPSPINYQLTISDASGQTLNQSVQVKFS